MLLLYVVMLFYVTYFVNADVVFVPLKLLIVINSLNFLRIKNIEKTGRLARLLHYLRATGKNNNNKLEVKENENNKQGHRKKRNGT